MSIEATREYTMRMRFRYRRAKTKAVKGRLLDEFCETTAVTRKHAIKVLVSDRDPLRPAGRKSEYENATEDLKKIWLMFDQPCSKLLRPVMGSYVESYERHEGPLDPLNRELLLQMSESTIDRLLRPFRVRTSLWRGRGGPMNLMKRQIEVRSEQWDGRGPGWFEADSVAHCGGSMAGSFAYTLTFTDTDTQWTELRSVWNRGGHATTIRVQEIEEALPFAINGVNTDNGSEFLNWHLIRHLKGKQTPVTQTRSRPYHKNDNARVEQKNGSLVRSLLGYDRFDDPGCIDDLNEILTLHSAWTNLFRPCMKLISKTRDGRRYHKKYDKPATPAQRLMNSDHATAEVRKAIEIMRESYDCYSLKSLVQEKLQDFFRRYVDGEKVKTDDPVASPPTSPLRGALSGTVVSEATGCRGRRRKDVKVPA